MEQFAPPASHVVAEHQLFGVGMEVDLGLNVFDPMAVDVVAKQGEGDDKRDQLPALVLQDT